MIAQCGQSRFGQEVKTQVRSVEGRVKVLRVLVSEVLVLFRELFDHLLAEFVVSIRSRPSCSFLNPYSFVL